MRIIKNLWRAITGFFPWYANLYKGRPWYTKTLLGITSFIVAFFIYLGMVDINLFWLFGKSPGFSEIQTPPTFSASIIYSSDSVMIGKYFKQNRMPIRYDEVNPSFWQALVDTEDERFYSHHGIDYLGIGGAIKDAITRSDARGASTITQQLAKNMFSVRSKTSTGLLGYVPGLRMLINKSKEWIIATKLELIYNKQQIITMYANTVDFGNNAYGIMTAAKTYFDKKPSELTPEQCATLVGMLKATTTYNPIRHPENALKRRNTVLYNMMTHGDLAEADYQTYSKRPLGAELHVEENYDGQAQYFREAISKYLSRWLKDNDYDLYSSGLRIYTTIDTRMQKLAEDAAHRQMRVIQRNFDNHWSIRRNADHWQANNPWRDENGNEVPGFIEGIAERLPIYRQLQQRYHGNMDSVMNYLNTPRRVMVYDYDKGRVEKTMSTMDSIRYMVSFMHTAMVAMEPQTGAVRAWVGDVNFDTWKYDKVTSERQPGSTFKLFVYTEAMNQGLIPCDKRRDQYVSMQVLDKKTGQYKTWTPTNANGRFSNDSIALMSAFAQSINSIAVNLGQEVGISNIIKTAQAMGIESPLENEPSLALGSSDVNLLEMVNAYSTIANDGKRHSPVLVTKILDHDGNEVYTAPDDQTQAIPYKTAFLMQQMLKAGHTEPHGTSMPINAYITNDTEWGGKTGTSNNHSDAWFMAVSPNLVVGSWVGGEYRCIHFRTGALGQGSRTALPVVGEFIKALMNNSYFHNKYKGKWPPADRDEIEPTMYQCQQRVIHTQEVDTAYQSHRRHYYFDDESEEDDELQGHDPTEPSNTDREATHEDNNPSNATPSRRNKDNIEL